MQQLTAWDNFYVIIGSAAATLTGLMFIVVTLIAQGARRGTSDTMGAFNSPSIVHFCSALVIAALLSAPWTALWQPGLLLGLAGLGGLLYMRIVLRRTRRQTDYTPVLEDQLWHMLFPLVAYAALAVAALIFVGNAAPALFVAGAALVLLLLIGIHNAWDNVTFVVFTLPSLDQRDRDERRGTDAAERPTPNAH